MTGGPSIDASLPQTEVSPLLAIALLEGLRSVDTPRERLEEEVLSRNLPRRLGLSRAVDAQIRRYQDLREQKRSVTGQEVVDLFVLVGRRPDAEAVFEEAGTWLANQRLRKRRFRVRLATLALPALVRRRLALRSARSVARLASPIGTVRSETKPMALVLEGSLPAHACHGPESCSMLLASFRTSLVAYGLDGPAHSPPAVVHPLCEARGDSCCVWRRVDPEG